MYYDFKRENVQVKGLATSLDQSTCTKFDISIQQPPTPSGIPGTIILYDRTIHFCFVIVLLDTDNNVLLYFYMLPTASIHHKLCKHK